MAYSIDTVAAIADATKTDLETLEAHMNGRMDILEAHLVAKIAIAQVATATLLFAALKFFG